MSYVWTDSMGPASPGVPQLETAARGAIIAACVFMDALDPKADLPMFHGGRFLVAANKTASDLAAAAMNGVVTTTAVQSQTVLATAVLAALVFKDAGCGDAGWAAVQAASIRYKQVA
jgi:hypothetical protein